MNQPGTFRDAMDSLALLRRMYNIVDASMAVATHNAARPPACSKGCGNCCIQPVPVTLLEVMGIQLYVSQIGLPHHRPTQAKTSERCVFLSDGNFCLIYPYRPIACRRFIVLGKPCALNEDAMQTRPHDVLRPSRSALLRALRLSADYYVQQELLPSPPQSMEDFRHVSLVLADVFGNK